MLSPVAASRGLALPLLLLSMAACGRAAETRPAEVPSSQVSRITLDDPTVAGPGSPPVVADESLPDRPRPALGSSNGSSTPNVFAVNPSAAPTVSPLDAPVATKSASLF